MTLIGVKSKYGSCKGTCMGWINLTKIKFVNLFKVIGNKSNWFNSRERNKLLLRKVPLLVKWVEL